MSISHLDTLPVEILYRIFDNLDVRIILFSFRYVCKRFYSISNSYNRYNFNFASKSKSHFYFICRTIPFEQVTELTLSDEDKTHGQIRLFLSLFHTEQFTRLRSLTLIQIEDNDLKVFLNYVVNSSLTYLSIDTQTFNLRKNIALNILSSAIGHHTLQKLDLNMWFKDMNELQWPVYSMLNYLRIRNSITLDQFYLILQYSPCLQTVILKDFNMDGNSETLSIIFDHTQFPQLTSLSCEGGRIQMDKLEQCLSLIPALVRLKLVGDGNLVNSSFDGYRWEQIIQSKLPLLKNFEFFISTLTYVNYDTNNIEEIISLFRTPFWLNEKQCHVICDYIIYLHKLLLYSVPICTHDFEYHSNANKVSSSNFTMKNNVAMMMDNVQQLDLYLTKVMSVDQTEEVNDLLFRNITEFKLGINGEWPIGSVKFLSTIIDLSHIVKLSLYVNFFHEYMPSIVHSINKLLKRASNIRSLSLFDYLAPYNCTTNMETICPMITSNIKHLQIRVKNGDDVKFIIQNLEHLRSVTFEYTRNLIWIRGELVDCFSDLERHSSQWESRYALHVWFDNK